MWGPSTGRLRQAWEGWQARLRLPDAAEFSEGHLCLRAARRPSPEHADPRVGALARQRGGGAHINKKALMRNNGVVHGRAICYDTPIIGGGMGYHTPTRDEALALLHKYNDNPALIKHGLAVEAVLQDFAKKFGEDVGKWGIIGLVHDLDWGKFPDEHCAKTAEILQQENWDPQWIRAIQSHGWGICTDVEPQEKMEWVLYTIDELTGLITATVYLRPSKSVMDLELRSVKKKWKQKGFAAGVDRDIIAKGAERLGMELDQVITETIGAMRGAADALGLVGSVPG